MRTLSACLVLVALSAGDVGAANAPQAKSASVAKEVPWESFEQAVPAYYTTNGGSLSLTQDHAVSGDSSLRWDFQDKDVLVIRTGTLGDLNVRTGYGGYDRSSFAFSLYLPKLGKGSLRIEFRAGKEVAAVIKVPFAHVGWQSLCYHYTWDSKMEWLNPKVKGAIDRIHVIAVGVEGRTYACLDQVACNQPLPVACSAATAPFVSKDWGSRGPAPTGDQLACLAALGAALRPAPDPSIREEVWVKKAGAWRAKVVERGYVKACKSVDTARMEAAFGLLNAIADDCCTCTFPGPRAELLSVFREVNGWLQAQGLVAQGALGALDSYGGRLYADAVSKMHDDLLAADPAVFKAIHDYLKWSYRYDQALTDGTDVRNMDYFHNDAARLLRIAEMEPDLPRRWHQVDLFRRRLAKQLAASIKPDGALFHHGFHYFGYGGKAVESVSGLLATLSGVGLPVPKEGLDAVASALESMDWYSGRTILWSLHGRDASGRLEIPAKAYIDLAGAYAPYPEAAARRDGLISTYLRNRPDQAGLPIARGLQPAKAPEGFRTMPYAALALHRRDNWLVGIKGFSRYAAHGESYANANRFGLFMAHGQLEILTHPVEAPTVLGSGTEPDRGYDWCAVDGVTSPYVDLMKIANGNGTRTLWSKETFVGGVSARSNGVFAMRLDDESTSLVMADEKPKVAPGNLKALKSWFCFGNRIVCLGTDISARAFPYPVRTTLFQKLAEGDHAGIVVNGAAWVGTDDVKEWAFDVGRAMLRDPLGNAYAIPAARGLRVRYGLQASRDSNDKGVTRARYARAWFEHGPSPVRGGYEYVVLVQPEPSQVSGYWESSGHRVLSRDARAHVVTDAETASMGYAIFEPKTALPGEGMVLEVSRPCLIMVVKEAAGITLAVADPDVRPEARCPVPLRVRLRGRFACADPAVSHSAEGVTTVVVPTLHGESHVYGLKVAEGK